MSQTDAQLRASKKYHKEKLENITFRVPKGEKEIIVAHAQKKNESTNAFIYRAVKEAINREKD